MTDLLTLLRKIGDAGPDGYQPRANTPGVRRALRDADAPADNTRATVRRLILAGAVAASARRVQVVLKLDVEPGTAPAVAAALNTAKGATFEAAQHARRRKGAPPK